MVCKKENVFDTRTFLGVLWSGLRRSSLNFSLVACWHTFSFYMQNTYNKTFKTLLLLLQLIPSPSQPNSSVKCWRSEVNALGEVAKQQNWWLNDSTQNVSGHYTVYKHSSKMNIKWTLLQLLQCYNIPCTVKLSMHRKIKAKIHTNYSKEIHNKKFMIKQ